MNILVTGSAGFIGVHLCQELRDHGHAIFPFDLAYGDDARDEATLTEACWDHRADMIVHLAAKVGRLFGEDDIQATVEDNAGMTANVAQVCAKLGIRLVYASTSEVYGDNNGYECEESVPLGKYPLPHNMYGLSKRWGEDACHLYVNPAQLLIWRISMPYGPGLPAGRGRAAIINFLYQALHNQPITVHKDSERSWCWVGDTVRAMRLTIEQRCMGVWNIGRDDNAVPMRYVAERAIHLSGNPKGRIVMVDPPERQTVVKRLATEKIRALGWEPQVTLDEGMRRTLEYVRGLPAPDALPVAA